MNKLKLGIIGLNEGNGHPYSWSAIFNGYNKALMADCPFPTIPEYLGKQQFPRDAIKNARVTHIWAQSLELSKNIAAATNIENIAYKYTDMIGKVDAILLARDDAENHYHFCEPFIRAGLPIYIDKLLAPTVLQAQKILALQQYKNQIFTGSALAYAREFQVFNQLPSLGDLYYVDACVMKDWSSYGIHIVEPVLKLLAGSRKIVSIKSHGSSVKRNVMLNYDDGLKVDFISLGIANTPIVIRLFGSRNLIELKFSDTFAAFKAALQAFIDVVRGKALPSSQDFILQTVRIIEQGEKNA